MVENIKQRMQMCCGPREKETAFVDDGIQPGVGILCEHTQDGKLVVHSMQQEGPAFQNGCISVGDVLEEIDGAAVSDMPVIQIKQRLDGANGSVVQIGFRRPNGELYRVTLVRGYQKAKRQSVASLAERMCQPITKLMPSNGTKQ